MHGSYRARWRTCLLFDSIWSVFQTLVTHDWVSEGQWRADASSPCIGAGFGILKKKKKKGKRCYLHLCMYLLLNVINCIFNTVVIVLFVIGRSVLPAFG